MMYFRTIFIGLFCLLVSLKSFSSARLEATPNALHRYAFQHPQMGTVFRLVFFTEKDSVQAGAIARQIFDRIDTLNAIFSDWLPESELNRLCSLAGSGSKIPVSAELFNIIVLSKKYSKKTDGAFDITVGPLTRLWRRARSLKELPTETRVHEATEKVGWENIEVFRKARCVRLKKPGMGLDLGGIAQGWTADDCLKILKKQGINRALVDAGGDIAIGDAPPGEMGWTIEVPEGVDKAAAKALQNCGITTSGATYRFLELDGKRYSHIIDPRTGMPLTHRTLVTVRAPNATTADAWATAISVSGGNGRKKAIRSEKKLEIWLSEMPL